MSHTDMGIVGATTDSFILFENGVRRNRLVLPGLSNAADHASGRNRGKGQRPYVGSEKSMAEIPKPSDIQNVFALNKPQHMLSKLLWEIDSLSKSLSVWTKRSEFPEPLLLFGTLPSPPGIIQTGYGNLTRRYGRYWHGATN